MIRKGDLLTIRPAWRDPGEHQELYVAREDQVDDRVLISAIALADWSIWPTHLAMRDMVSELGLTISFPNVIKAFPDYDLSTLPPIPSGWVDSSWRNDATPSFTIDDHWQVFVDFEQQQDRESVGGRRYCVLDISGADVWDLLATDDWYAVLTLINRLQQEEESKDAAKLEG